MSYTFLYKKHKYIFQITPMKMKVTLIYTFLFIFFSYNPTFFHILQKKDPF